MTYSLSVKAFAIALAIPALANTARAAQADPIEHAASGNQACVRLLNDAGHVFDEHRLLDRAFHSRLFHNWLCKSGFHSQQEMESAATQLNMPNPDMSLILGYRLDQQSEAFEDGLHAFCTRGMQLQLDPVIHEHFQRMTSASMIDAVQSCLNTARSNTASSVFARPENSQMARFEILNTANEPIEIIESEGATCSKLTGQGAHGLSCQKPSWRSASLRLRIRGQEQELSLPGSMDMKLLALEERTLILGDRIRFLEQSLTQPMAYTERSRCNGNTIYPSAPHVCKLAIPVQTSKPRNRLLSRAL